MSGSWQWNGSRWWKVDFHAHSMASSDYGKDTPDQSSLRTRRYEDWLKDFMRAEIDCVVIADHNTGAGIDPARSALAAMAGSGDPEYRMLFLLPGIELSVQGGVHILGILPAHTSTSDVDTLLGVVGYLDGKGSSTGVTREPAAKVIDAIAEMGGIAVPAHVDDAAGLFSLSEATLRQALTAKSLIALESRHATVQVPPGIRASELPLAIIAGSDAHHPSGKSGQSYPGSRYTWVKMSSPTLQGLHLALMDGPLSLARSDSAPVSPNRVPALTIESIAVADATYIGKSNEFMLSMNPWLNAVVGGRGTGKSTVVEFLRQALQRRAELPDEFSEEHAKYETVDGEDAGGLLGPNTTVVITYRKDETRFRIRWTAQDRDGSIEEETASGWTRVPGDIASRFPVRVYSQKQVFHLARDPQALLKIIDEAPPVDGRTWRATLSTNRSRFLALRAQAREIEASLSRESELKGELEDVRRLLDLFDRSNHAAILRSYRDASRQDAALRKWEDSWSDAGGRVRELAATITPDSLNDPSLGGDTQELGELRRNAEGVRAELAAVGEGLLASAASIDTIYSRWTDLLKRSSWRATADAAVSSHADLVSRLEGEGVSSPGEYADLVARQTALEHDLAGLAERRAESSRLRAEADDLLRQIQDERRSLSDLRNEFLKEVLKGNRYVRIRVIKYGALDGVERSFRRLIDRSDGSFARFVGTPSELNWGWRPVPTRERMARAVGCRRSR